MDKPLVITRHAREAMMMRRVSMDDVIETIQHPEVTDKSHNNQKRYFRGQICVVTMDGYRNVTVKTVLFRIADTWTDKDVRLRK